MKPASYNIEQRLLLAILAGLAVLSAAMLFWQALAPQTIHVAGLTIDRLSAVLTLLVAAVGAVCFRFSMRYLDREAGHRRFLYWLSFSVVMAYLLMMATNLLVLFVTWWLVSMGLHKLLTHYADRPEAVPPARKKFLISRLGDIALILAIVLIWQGWGTLDLHVFLANAEAGPKGWLVAVAMLVVIAALTKSAQFPFHSWLPETMESPTPVSALMHAGIINAGGVLILRFSPVIIMVPEALLLLSLVGTITVAIGLLAMWAQVKIKRILAWSTVSQMGFMIVQCGLAAFPAAALHIVGHGFYKAFAFLRSGDVPPPLPRPNPLSPAATLLLATVGTVLAVPAMALAAVLTGIDPLRSPGEMGLAAIVALSIGQVWVSMFRARAAIPVRLLCSAVSTVGLAIALFAFYAVAKAFLTPALGLPAEVPDGFLVWLAAILPVVVLAVLAVVHALLPELGKNPAGRAFHVHALNGFYFGAMADRLVARVWRNTDKRSISHA